MSIDIYLRAETPGTLKTAMTSDRVSSIVGDVLDENGNIRLRGNNTGETSIGGNWKYFPPDTVVVVPGEFDVEGNALVAPVLDPWCWLNLRLARAAAINDEKTGATEDRWDRSRIIDWIKSNGTIGTLDQMPPWDQVAEAANVTGAVFDLQGGAAHQGRIAVTRAQELDNAGLLFHHFLGVKDF